MWGFDDMGSDPSDEFGYSPLLNNYREKSAQVKRVPNILSVFMQINLHDFYSSETSGTKISSEA
jgi:hypothetical protein